MSRGLRYVARSYPDISTLPSDDIILSLDLYGETGAIPLFRRYQKAYLQMLSNIMTLKFLEKSQPRIVSLIIQQNQ